MKVNAINTNYRQNILIKNNKLSQNSEVNFQGKIKPYTIACGCLAAAAGANIITTAGIDGMILAAAMGITGITSGYGIDKKMEQYENDSK